MGYEISGGKLHRTQRGPAMSIWGTVVDLERDMAMKNDPESLRAEIKRQHDLHEREANKQAAKIKRLLGVLQQIADGTIPREMLEQWQGLSEEAWYEQRGEYLQNLAQEAIKPDQH